MTGWGKAGQRLTPREVAERQRRAGLNRLRREQARLQQLTEGRRLWEAGQLVPAAITFALGDRDGPEVDLACRAVEPEVDHWELGILYPTWEQTVALADLTGLPVAALCRAPMPIDQTTLWLHMTAAASRRRSVHVTGEPDRGACAGRLYLERGRPVLVERGWRGPGPRNVLLLRSDGTRTVRPFRGLRRVRTLLDLAGASGRPSPVEVG